MSHAKNKVEWCLKKAEKELKETGKHRGLVRITPNPPLALDHLKKAEHYLKATEHLKKDFSDISTSTVFYAMYHCLLSIAAQQGYKSRNQECTFALIYELIEDKSIDFPKELLEQITELDVQKEKEELTSTEIREEYQYDTKLSVDESLYEKLFTLATIVIAHTREIIQK